jgi:mannose-1-phosphate guanylyltransferase
VGNEINAGVYIINNEMINHIQLKNSSIEREFFPIISKTGQMFSFLHIGYWKDIGTPNDYLLAN